MGALLGLDGASAFDLAAAKRAGVILATVYIVGTPGGMPHADKARVDEIRADGMGALPNWERAADFFSTCTLAEARAAGAEGATASQSLGFPADGSVGVAFSFDFDCTASRFPEMGAKVDQVKGGLAGRYKAMIYGQQALLDYLVTHGHVSGKHWLMMSTFNQPYTPTDPNVCMVQGHDVGGNWISSPVAGTDPNTITDPHAVPAWWPAGSPYGGDAPMTPAEIKAVADAVWAKQFHVVKADGTSGSGDHSAASWLTAAASNAGLAVTAAGKPATVDATAIAQQVGQALATSLGPDFAKQVAKEIPNYVTLASKP